MSKLTLVLGFGAAVLVALFVLNALFHCKPRDEGLASSPLTSRVGAPGLLSATLIVAGLLAALLSRIVFPDSAFSVWLAEPMALLVFAIWTWIVATLASTLVQLMLRRRQAAQQGSAPLE